MSLSLVFLHLCAFVLGLDVGEMRGSYKQVIHLRELSFLQGIHIAFFPISISVEQ